jgi:AraC-like DNA-binding protein
MESNSKGEAIKVWRPGDMSGLELRRGYSVARPVPRHWHEEYQFCFIHSGPGELKYRGKDLPTPPASLFIVHPGEVHANRCYEGSACSYRTIFVDPALMRQAAIEVYGREAGLPFFPTAVVFDEDLLAQYVNLHAALEQPSSSLARQGLLLELLTGLILRFAEQRSTLRAFGLERQAVKRACDYLNEHFAENISLDQLAGLANLSPFHFSRVFSQQFGMPPHAFQTQLRVLRAKALLRQGWTIARAASETGFADQSHFTRHFKRLVVVTPGQYLQNSKNVQDNR